jgi:hypothetical protein
MCVRVMVLNATLNNISVILWWSVLLVEETGVHGENNRPLASRWQTLSHNVVSSTPHHHNITEILLRVALNTMKPNQTLSTNWLWCIYQINIQEKKLFSFIYPILLIEQWNMHNMYIVLMFCIDIVFFCFKSLVSWVKLKKILKSNWAGPCFNCMIRHINSNKYK